MGDADLQQALADLDQQLLRITEAVQGGEVLALEAASTALRASAMALLVALERADMHPDTQAVHGVEARRHLQQLAMRLATARAGMMRRAALVEQTLQAMVPGALSPTYASQASPYRSARKQTGAFQTLAA